jgi:hypothetical protein
MAGIFKDTNAHFSLLEHSSFHVHLTFSHEFMHGQMLYYTAQATCPQGITLGGLRTLCPS